MARVWRGSRRFFGQGGERRSCKPMKAPVQIGPGPEQAWQNKERARLQKGRARTGKTGAKTPAGSQADKNKRASAPIYRRTSLVGSSMQKKAACAGRTAFNSTRCFFLHCAAGHGSRGEPRVQRKPKTRRCKPDSKNQRAAGALAVWPMAGTAPPCAMLLRSRPLPCTISITPQATRGPELPAGLVL